MPVFLGDVHHVINAGVVPEVHLGQTEVRAFAGVPGNDVVDHRAIMLGCDLAHPAEFLLRAERGVNRHTDPVEVPIDTRGLGPAADAAGELHGAGVEAADTDLAEGFPELRITQRRQERLVFAGNEGQRVCREPDRRFLYGCPGVGPGVGVLPHARLA